MPRERRTFAVVGRLLAIALIVAFGQVLPGQAATGRESGHGAPGPPSFQTRRRPTSAPATSSCTGRSSRLQERAEWARADRLIARLDDRVLLGHVLYQRYMHPTGYRSSFEELSAWLDKYADHPDADRVYRLALRRRPPGAPAPARPRARLSRRRRAGAAGARLDPLPQRAGAHAERADAGRELARRDRRSGRRRPRRRRRSASSARGRRAFDRSGGDGPRRGGAWRAAISPAAITTRR